MKCFSCFQFQFQTETQLPTCPRAGNKGHEILCHNSLFLDFFIINLYQYYLLLQLLALLSMSSANKARRRNQSKASIMIEKSSESRKRSMNSCPSIGNDNTSNGLSEKKSSPKRRKVDHICNNDPSSPTRDATSAIANASGDQKLANFEFRVIDAFPNDTTEKIIFISFLNQRDHGWILQIINNVFCCCLVKGKEDIDFVLQKCASAKVKKMEGQLELAALQSIDKVKEVLHQLEDSKKNGEVTTKAANDDKWKFQQELQAKNHEIDELQKSEKYAKSELRKRTNALIGAQKKADSLEKDSIELKERKREGTLGELSIAVNEILVNAIKCENSKIKEAIISFQLSNLRDKDKFNRLESLRKLSKFEVIQKSARRNSLLSHYYKLLKLCYAITGNRNDTHHTVYAEALVFANTEAKNIVRQKFNGNQYMLGKLTGGPNAVLDAACSKLEKKKV